MKKVVLIAVLLLAGCGQTRFSSDESRKAYQQERFLSLHTVCRDGVEYLAAGNSYGSSYTPHFKVDGSLYTC